MIRVNFNRAKYGAKRVESDGRSFASKLERDTYGILNLMQINGAIRDLKCQVQVLLSAAKIIYKPDFQFFDCEKSQDTWAESKGFETPEWKIKKRLWQAYGPGPLWIFKSARNGPQMTEIVQSKGIP